MSGRVSDTSRQGTTAVDRPPHDRLEHDLRQSLCAMTAILDLVRQAPLGRPEVLRHLELIRRESDWAVSVLADDEEQRPLDVGEVVEAAWRMVAEESPCPVRLVREPVPVTVLDPVRLGCAVRNLLDNAVRAAGPDGAVEVRVGTRGQDVVIEVADSGPGFGRIPRVHGIGLGTVRQLAAHLGGRLEIGTDRLGGALLALELPARLEQVALVGEAI